LNYLFIIQGEGRGHMTQALSLANILRKNGHKIGSVIVGSSERRSIPAFFTEKIGAPVVSLPSPNFVTDKDHKKVKPLRTVIYSLLKAPIYRKSIQKIDEIVKEEKPDVIINFYDFLGGLYYFSKRPKAKLICIGHQYLFGHPDYHFPKGKTLDRLSMLMGNKVTSLGASKLLALSFYPEESKKKKLLVVPPLLRDLVKNTVSSKAEHYLVYMVNPGYADEINQFHEAQPSQSIHAFWDKKDAETLWKIDETLTYHQLNDELFIQYMSSAKGYVTTAGFESVCEAMYLGKPVMMVPVGGHFEQACNALDAEKAGAGIASKTFDIGKLYDYIPHHKDVQDSFKGWADQAEDIFIKHLT
jgi:uncharacterized protein (TIGR00661 family)